MVWAVRWLGVMTVVCFFSREARAESIERFAVSAEGTLFEIESLTLLRGDFSSEEDVDFSSTTIGVLGGGFGVGLGYGVGPNVLLGAQFSVVKSTVKLGLPGSEDAGVSGFSLSPRIEYVFSEDSAFRPFLMGRLGVRSQTNAGGDEDTTLTLYYGGVGIGAHAFATSSFSIDPLLSVNLNTGGYHRSEADEDIDAFGTSVSLTIAFTGWLGGAPGRSTGVSGDAFETATSANGRGASIRAREELEPNLLARNETLPEGHLISLKARPEVARTTVLVQIIEAAGPSELLNCNDIRIVAAGFEYTTRRVREPQRQVMGKEWRIVTEVSTASKALARCSSTKTLTSKFAASAGRSRSPTAAASGRS